MMGKNDLIQDKLIMAAVPQAGGGVGGGKNHLEKWMPRVKYKCTTFRFPVIIFHRAQSVVVMHAWVELSSNAVNIHCTRLFGAGGLDSLSLVMRSHGNTACLDTAPFIAS